MWAAQAQVCAGESLSVLGFKDPYEPTLQIQVLAYCLGAGNRIHGQLMEEVGGLSTLKISGQSDLHRKPPVAHNEVAEVFYFQA